MTLGDVASLDVLQGCIEGLLSSHSSILDLNVVKPQVGVCICRPRLQRVSLKLLLSSLNQSSCNGTLVMGFKRGTLFYENSRVRQTSDASTSSSTSSPRRRNPPKLPTSIFKGSQMFSNNFRTSESICQTDYIFRSLFIDVELTMLH